VVEGGQIIHLPQPHRATRTLLFPARSCAEAAPDRGGRSWFRARSL